MTYIKDVIKLIILVQFTTAAIVLFKNISLDAAIHAHALVLLASLVSGFIFVPLLEWWMD